MKTHSLLVAISSGIITLALCFVWISSRWMDRSDQEPPDALYQRWIAEINEAVVEPTKFQTPEGVEMYIGLVPELFDSQVKDLASTQTILQSNDSGVMDLLVTQLRMDCGGYEMFFLPALIAEKLEVDLRDVADLDKATRSPFAGDSLLGCNIREIALRLLNVNATDSTTMNKLRKLRVDRSRKGAGVDS